MKKTVKIILLLLAIAPVIPLKAQKETTFTTDDRDRIIRTETKVDGLQKQMDDRFNTAQIDDLRSDMKWQFGLLISAMFILVGFILWDRRTFSKTVAQAI